MFRFDNGGSIYIGFSRNKPPNFWYVPFYRINELLHITSFSPAKSWPYFRECMGSRNPIMFVKIWPSQNEAIWTSSRWLGYRAPQFFANVEIQTSGEQTQLLKRHKQLLLIKTKIYTEKTSKFYSVVWQHRLSQFSFGGIIAHWTLDIFKDEANFHTFFYYALIGSIFPNLCPFWLV